LCSKSRPPLFVLEKPPSTICVRKAGLHRHPERSRGARHETTSIGTIAQITGCLK
jgi:hypothetical protein